MTFKELQDDCLERLTFDSSTASSTARTRIKRFLNEAYRRLLRRSGLGRATTGSTTITVVAGTATYTVTGAKIRADYDTTNNLPLVEISLSDLRRLDPGLDATGTPTAFAVTTHGSTTLTVQLYPKPTANGTLNVDIGAATTALSGDNDVPVIPIDFQYLLGSGARMLEYEKQEQLDRYRLAKTEFEEGVKELRFYLAKSGVRPRVPGTTVERSSRLGPWFEE